MCKIVTLSNTSKVKKLDKLVTTIAGYITESEQDGFGYAIQGTKGVFGERTTNTDDFEYSFDKPSLDVPFATKTYNRFGVKGDGQGPALFHGRTSTNHKTLINTHPLVKRDWYLIHNGVVSNHGPKYKAITTNDTEHLLEYISTTGIGDIEKYITGYYAVTAINPKGELVLFKDGIASLSVAFVSSIDSYIFATTEDLIKNICADMKWKHSVIETVYDDQYLVFKGNEIVEMKDIQPRGRSYVETQFAEKSLGRSLDTPLDTIGVVNGNTSIIKPEVGGKYTEDEMYFLEEVNNYADASYTFMDFRKEEITLEEFKELDDDDKLFCTVIRHDGTVCDPYNYHEERLYEGA